MRDVENVVVDELIMARDRYHVGLGAGPVGMVRPPPIRDQLRIGAFRIAHPDPDPVEALDQRISVDCGIGRDLRLARDLDAAAASIEAQSVIAATQRVAFESSLRQRQVAVTTTVLERDRGAVLLAVEDDRLAEDQPRERLAGQLTVPGGDVPGIAQKHDRPRSCSKQRMLALAMGPSKQHTTRGAVFRLNSRHLPIFWTFQRRFANDPRSISHDPGVPERWHASCFNLGKAAG